MAAAAVDEGLARRRAKDVELAVSEALTNVVAHAYRAPAPHPGSMTVELDQDDRELRVIVSDDGSGPGRPSRGTRLGIGVGIMAAAADRCEIRGEPGAGMQVTLGFALDDA